MSVVTSFVEWSQMYETQEAMLKLKTYAIGLEHDLKNVGLAKYERESGRITGIFDALRVIEELKEEE